MDKTAASAAAAPRALEDAAGSKSKSSGAGRKDVKKDAEEVKSKLAILKMKASILRAGCEVQAAVPRAPPGTSEAGTQTEPPSAERMGERMGVAVAFLDSVMSQDRAVDLVRRAVGPQRSH